MRTFPTHLTQTPFHRVDKWVDHTSGTLLWPALWWRKNLEKGLSVHYSTITLGIGHYRWRWTWGVQCDPIAGRIPGWDELGGDAFLEWARETFSGDWPRGQAQHFFRKNPRWRDMVALGGLETYYIRILLAREMLRARTIFSQIDGLDGLENVVSPS